MRRVDTAQRFASAPTGLQGDLPEDVDGTGQALDAGGPVVAFVADALHAASHHVFVATAVTAAVMGVAIAFVPRRTEPLLFED